ncbi:transporter substrate-binding domain-containing protein [Ruminococcaceae bacterium OttesenSCG-928-L11]|nr:transporter substrate-binding domain-containing protein [Ruminococcaceae bacterium OttesenSCG-928-L11]
MAGKLFRAMTTALAAALLLTACSGQAVSGTDTGKETLTIGVAGDYYPLCFTENDKNQGFEIDVWTEIGERTGRTVEFMVSDFTGLFGMLDAGKVDTVGYGIAITSTRQEKYLFSDPYLYSNYNLITLQDSELVALEDFSGKKVGVVMGGEGERKLIELSERENAGIDVVGYEGPAAMDEDIRLGRIDARVGPVIQTSANIIRNNLNFHITDITVYSETAGYPFPDDDAHRALREEINGVLAEMREDGTLTELSQRWFNLDATRQ